MTTAGRATGRGFHTGYRPHGLYARTTWTPEAESIQTAHSEAEESFERLFPHQCTPAESCGNRCSRRAPTPTWTEERLRISGENDWGSGADSGHNAVKTEGCPWPAKRDNERPIIFALVDFGAPLRCRSTDKIGDACRRQNVDGSLRCHIATNKRREARIRPIPMGNYHHRGIIYTFPPPPSECPNTQLLQLSSHYTPWQE